MSSAAGGTKPKQTKISSRKKQFQAETTMGVEKNEKGGGLLPSPGTTLLNSDTLFPRDDEVRCHTGPGDGGFILLNASNASESKVFNEGRSFEPLRPGVVITYWSPHYVMGPPRSRLETTVLATRPWGEPMLSLVNGECLPADTQVRRVRVFKYGKVKERPSGVYRRINQFRMTEASREAEDLEVVTEAERVGRAVARGKDAVRRERAAGSRELCLHIIQE
mmetsp:Transcript_42320/g.99276  ORF Transcript_42320/g.99276 Transcript_42320/m.99276 type:complete len:221 (-) Transcript_42320:973-1635(-)